MSTTTRWVLFLAVIAGAGAAYYLWSQREAPQPQPAAVEKMAAPAPAPRIDEVEALTRHPVPQAQPQDAEPAKPLPTLEDSDDAIQQALAPLFSIQPLDALLNFDGFINRVVVTVDNLPRAKLPIQRLPASPLKGKFLVKQEAGGAIEIDPGNYTRYTKYVELFEGMDSRKIAAVYFHFYPLFQDAYRDLGYKSAYFNDRVIAAIDDLLATPVVHDPVRLVQPSVFYKYADANLESLTAGQRLMIRIGGDNAARVKAKLRELRDALTKRADGG
jgi:hypothetical protein